MLRLKYHPMFDIDAETTNHQFWVTGYQYPTLRSENIADTNLTKSSDSMSLVLILDWSQRRMQIIFKSFWLWQYFMEKYIQNIQNDHAFLRLEINCLDTNRRLKWFHLSNLGNTLSSWQVDAVKSVTKSSSCRRKTWQSHRISFVE